MNERHQRNNAIISPRIDAICGGGLSLAVSLFIIAYGWLSEAGVTQVLVAIQVYLFTDLLINSPHFIASYRILYGRRKNLRQHPVVAILMPLAGFSFVGYVTYECLAHPEITSARSLGVITVLEWIAPIFLGWHYMGQSWGMTACFGFLGGLRMNDSERRMIRSGMHALFAYHVICAYEATGLVQSVLAEEEAGRYLMEFILSACRLGVFATFAIGLLGFRRLSQRESKPIPVQMWLPWVATFSWHVMLDVNPGTLFLLQIFHAIQYLSFPARVEMNAYAHATTPTKSPWRHLFLYYLALVAIGFLVFDWSKLVGGLPPAQLQIATAMMMFVNIHHYFTDAVIWKIRNPEVRQSLFGHLDAKTA